MKFLADMGISPKTVSFLRQQGYEAAHLADEGLFKASDETIVEMARQQERVVLTHDLDFGAIMARSGQKLPSVIIFRLSVMQPDNVNHYLKIILDNHSGDLEAGVILSVADGLIRVRQLPI